MDEARAAATILAEVDRLGVLLVHDQKLPSVTALVAGEVIGGSWWGHPMGKTIYNALGSIEDDVATVKLVGGKQTLVARRLWPELASVGAARDATALTGLAPAATTLLAAVDASADPVMVDKPHRTAADALEARLLVHVTDVHTDRGHHVKAYESWAAWAAARGVAAASRPDAARATITALVEAQLPTGTRRPRLPW